MNTNSIFKKGSKTFYTASLFFPKAIRKDVTRLYAYVRIADDLVDQVPQKKASFITFKKQTDLAFKSVPIKNAIIEDFVLLCREYDIEKKWVDAFLHAMEQDLLIKQYTTYPQLEKYIYGSAEVVGLMMARILRLPKKAEKAAMQQGKAMQLINFIRDIREDIDLGRQYIPQQDIEKFGLSILTPNVNEHAFNRLIQFELQRYMKIQNKAQEGYSYIPLRCRIPIATAAAMYVWTAAQIQKNPMVVFKHKIKPSKIRILIEYTKQLLTS